MNLHFSVAVEINRSPITMPSIRYRCHNRKLEAAPPGRCDGVTSIGVSSPQSFGMNVTAWIKLSDALPSNYRIDRCMSQDHPGIL